MPVLFFFYIKNGRCLSTVASINCLDVCVKCLELNLDVSVKYLELFLLDVWFNQINICFKCPVISRVEYSDCL